MKLSQWILFFSGVISALLVATAYQSPIVAQSALPQLSPQGGPAEIITQANPARVPSTVMAPADGSVSVQLINQTGQEISYQALGDTEPRVLAADSETTLQNLHVPATVTFAYKDIQKNRSTGSGLTQVDLRVNETKDHLDLVIQPTNSLDTEASNLTVESSGNVFVF